MPDIQIHVAMDQQHRHVDRGRVLQRRAFGDMRSRADQFSRRSWSWCNPSHSVFNSSRSVTGAIATAARYRPGSVATDCSAA